MLLCLTKSHWMEKTAEQSVMFSMDLAKTKVLKNMESHFKKWTIKLKVVIFLQLLSTPPPPSRRRRRRCWREHNNERILISCVGSCKENTSKKHGGTSSVSLLVRTSSGYSALLKPAGAHLCLKYLYMHTRTHTHNSQWKHRLDHHDFPSRV